MLISQSHSGDQVPIGGGAGGLTNGSSKEVSGASG